MQAHPFPFYGEGRAAERRIFAQHSFNCGLRSRRAADVWRCVDECDSTPLRDKNVGTVRLLQIGSLGGLSGNVLNVRSVSVSRILVRDRDILALSHLVYERRNWTRQIAWVAGNRG